MQSFTVLLFRKAGASTVLDCNCCNCCYVAAPFSIYTIEQKDREVATKIVTPLCGVVLVFLPMGSEAGIFMRLIMGSAPYFHPVFLSHKGPFISLCMLSLLVLSVLSPSACIDCPFSACSCWHSPLHVYLSFFLFSPFLPALRSFLRRLSFLLHSSIFLSFLSFFLTFFMSFFLIFL